MSSSLRSLVIIALFAIAGIVSAGYVLLQQRFPSPVRDVYTVRAALQAADGVTPGLGQPVEVAGVKVGMISDAKIDRGRAIVTLEINRKTLPAVYTDARVALQPVTPLKDMRIDLNPGRRTGDRLAPDGIISDAATTTPASLDEFLGALDTDTRSFLGSLLGSLGAGTAGRGADIDRALRTLGPTTAQVGRITRAIQRRRTELARLVHNVSIVTRAASQDDDLATVVVQGNATLRAIASQDVALRASIAKLPTTLGTTRTAIRNAASLAAELRPTASALQPTIDRLPITLAALKPLADRTSTTLQDAVRPLVRDLQPLLGTAAPALRRLDSATPDLTGTLKSTNYVLNSLAYNPPGNDEGFLFWGSLFFHNWNSLFSVADAHGGIGRAMVTVNCQQVLGLLDLGTVFKGLTGTSNLCPAK